MMKPIKAFIAPGTPDQAAYASLSAIPDAPLVRPKRLPPRQPSGAEHRPRRLSDAQRKTVLGEAADAVALEAQQRTGKVLRRIEAVRGSGCRANQGLWNNLAALAEPMLARIDFATMALGWLDQKSGDFRVNRQNMLAVDAGISEYAVSRTFKALEYAGYVYRKIHRLYKNGTHWVTRVLIKIRPRFFIDLGLGHAFAMVRSLKRDKRALELARLGQRIETARVEAAGERVMRKQSHKKAQAARRAREQEEARQGKDAYTRKRNDLRIAFAQAHPDLKGLAREQAFARAHPEYVLEPHHKFPS